MSNFSAWLSAELATKELPAWLQAFAALTALVISVWAAYRVGASERRKDALLSKGIAVAIYSEIQILGASVKHTRTELVGLRARAGHLVGQSIAADFGLIGTIPVPPMLDRNTDNLYALGKAAGPRCLLLVSLLMQYNLFIEDTAMRIASLSAGQWGEFVDQAAERLKRLDDIRAKCEHDVEKIYKTVHDF